MATPATDAAVIAAIKYPKDLGPGIFPDCVSANTLVER